MQNALTLIREGLVDDPPLFQFCLGITSGAPATVEALLAMKTMLPPGAKLGGIWYIPRRNAHSGAHYASWWQYSRWP